MSETLTLSEAAQRAGVSRSTIRRRHEAGKFPNAHLDGGEWRIPIEDLEDAGLVHRAAYSVTTLGPMRVDPGIPGYGPMPAHPAQSEPAQRPPDAQPTAREHELLAQIAHEREGRLVAEAIAHERGLALADFRSRAIESAPERTNAPRAIEARGARWWDRVRALPG